MIDKERYELAEAEVARLENIIKIQQKQIERLLDQRDILERRGGNITFCFCPRCGTQMNPKHDPSDPAQELCFLAECGKEATWQDALHGQPIAGGRKYCQQHALCYTRPETVMPYHATFWKNESTTR